MPRGEPAMTLCHDLGGAGPACSLILDSPPPGCERMRSRCLSHSCSHGTAVSTSPRRLGKESVKPWYQASENRQLLTEVVGAINTLSISEGLLEPGAGSCTPLGGSHPGSVSLSTLFFWKTHCVRKSDINKISIPWVSSPTRVLWMLGGWSLGGGGV